MHYLIYINIEISKLSKIFKTWLDTCAEQQSTCNVRTVWKHHRWRFTWGSKHKYARYLRYLHKTPTLVFLRRALARHINCLWPTERLEPPSRISWSSPDCRCVTMPWTWGIFRYTVYSQLCCRLTLRWACSKAVHITESEYLPSGSKFILRVPAM